MVCPMCITAVVTANAPALMAAAVGSATAAKLAFDKCSAAAAKAEAAARRARLEAVSQRMMIKTPQIREPVAELKRVPVELR